MAGNPVGFGRDVGPRRMRWGRGSAAPGRANSPEAREQDLQARVAELRQLETEDPEGRWFLPLGGALRDLGHFEEAAFILRRGLERDPESLGGWVILGQCYAAMGEIQVARGLFEWISSRDPDNALVLRGLADILARQGERRRAADCYRALIKVMPRDLAAQDSLAGLLDHLPPADEAPPGVSTHEDAAGDAADAASGTPETTRQGRRSGRPVLPGRRAEPRPSRGMGPPPESRPRPGIFEPLPADLDWGESRPGSRPAGGGGEAGKRVHSGYWRWLARMTEEEEGPSDPPGKE